MSPMPMSGTMHHNTVRGGMPMSAQSQLQHKRSLSFNHHLNYNQYQLQQQQQHLQQTPQQPQSLQGNVSSSFNNTYLPYQTPPARPSHNPYQTLRDVAARTTPPAVNQRGENSLIIISCKVNSHPMRPSFLLLPANWSFTQLKPAPPVRHSFVSNSHQSAGGTNATSGGTGSANTSANGLSVSSGTPTRKIPPTYEEDALVLRVIESYCAAYQNTNRNTTHSGESRLTSPSTSTCSWHKSYYARRR